MYGLHGPAEMDGDYIKPVVTENGIPVMSINLLLPDEESPVIWSCLLYTSQESVDRKMRCCYTAYITNDGYVRAVRMWL